MNVSSFPPIVDSRSRILILGSMPGVASLRAHRYYWNERNFMWRILYRLFGDGKSPDLEYESRITFALNNGIAMWDVIASCEREGSLDSNIKHAIPNDIPGLLVRYPNIAVVACNGTKSYTEMMKHYGSNKEIAERKVLRLPSTSPIPTKNYRGLEDRLEAWRILLEIK